MIVETKSYSLYDNKILSGEFIMLNDDNKKICLEQIGQSINYCNEILREFCGKEISIKYSIISSMDFNAKCSLLENGIYSIEILSEVFEKTFDILNTLLYEKNSQFYSIISYGEENYNKVKANKYLDIMHAISTRLIIFHELGHIFNGHLDYYQAHKTDKGLSFYMDSSRNNLPPLESQILEMDADAFAATRLVGQLTFPANIDRLNGEILDLIKGEMHTLILLIVSSCLSFSIMGLGRKREPGDYLNSKYLPLRTRQDYYVRCTLNAFRMLNRTLIDKVNAELLDIKFYREVLYNIEQYVNLYFQEALGIPQKQMDSSNNKNELDEKLLSHADYLEEFWTREMRIKLLPFSYFDLAL
ncbi:hypothetical protein [Paenibacillus sp. RC84]|uniref:hypothetical protein n=1 Tax=Paenibacillus sp. RC84 TaxID=3156252 RepID=UPI003512C49F